MKTFPSMLFLVLAGGLIAGSPATAGELRITVRNVKPEQGAVMVALYADAAAWVAEQRFAGQQLPAVGATVTAVFTGLSAGSYAVAVYQDINGDGMLDSNLFGVPTEPYGFGGDVAGDFGPPSFKAVAVAVGDGAAADITATLTP